MSHNEAAAAAAGTSCTEYDFLHSFQCPPPQFTVNIALLESSRPVLGVVAVPVDVRAVLPAVLGAVLRGLFSASGADVCIPLPVWCGLNLPMNTSC